MWGENTHSQLKKCVCRWLLFVRTRGVCARHFEPSETGQGPSRDSWNQSGGVQLRIWEPIVLWNKRQLQTDWNCGRSINTSVWWQNKSQKQRRMQIFTFKVVSMTHLKNLKKMLAHIRWDCISISNTKKIFRIKCTKGNITCHRCNKVKKEMGGLAIRGGFIMNIKWRLALRLL